MTRFEKIKQMNLEQFTKWFSKHSDLCMNCAYKKKCPNIAYLGKNYTKSDFHKNCYKGYKEWLNSEI